MSDHRSNGLILSLFDYSGVWSQPYRENGYEVIQVDLKLGSDIFTFDYQNLNVMGILAAPECTDFAVSGARWFVEKDNDGRTEESIRQVKKTLEIINYLKPVFWVLENPIGRIHALVPEIGRPLMYFDPCEYALYADNPAEEAYTKRTALYGRFNSDLVKKPVEPILGSKMHLLGPSEDRAELRSKTPEGFSRAFFEVNDPLHKEFYPTKNGVVMFV